MNYAPDMCRKSAHLRNQRKDAAVTLIHVVTVADEFFVSFFFFLMGEKISKGKVREKRGQL